MDFKIVQADREERTYVDMIISGNPNNGSVQSEARISYEYTLRG
ncbi:hypothetical protein [Sutcliffiella cohnii]|nr:hypothetical protein [Sutcliffiella cohnii]